MKKTLTAIVFITSGFSLHAQKAKPYSFYEDIRAAADSVKNPMDLQYYAVDFTKSGNYKASLAVEKEFVEKTQKTRNVPDRVKGDSVYFSGFHPLSAVSAVAAEAEKYRVVITNEAHYQPMNRVFTACLLDSLYKKGYRYFCPEGLGNRSVARNAMIDSGLNSRKYPSRFSGPYIGEPQYGNLIRHALEIGYTVVPYEYDVSHVKGAMEAYMAREKGQADNIAAILQKDPNARILVHCGYGHLDETHFDTVGLMGAMLNIGHNIDPLTVDQEEMLEENHSDYRNWAKVKVPSVFKRGATFFKDTTAHRKVDMVVFFPPVTYVKGRPDWLFFNKRSKSVAIPPIHTREVSFPVMVKAFYKEEDMAIAVPADVIELQNAGFEEMLVLTKGNYVLEVTDRKGNHYTEPLVVK